MAASPFLFLAPLNGSLAFNDRAGGGTLTGSGAVRYQAASGARTNLFSNPTAANNTTGLIGQAGGTVSRISGDGALGTTCYEMTTVGGATDAVIQTSQLFRMTSGATYTLSFYAKLISGSSSWTAGHNKFNAAGTYIASSAPNAGFTPTSSWSRFTATGAAGTLGELFGSFWSCASASVIRVSNIQLETGATATAYFDGSTGGAWLDPITGILGTAHASPSVSQAVAWVEEGTTNQCINPSFETNTTSWAAPAAGTTLSRDTTYAYIGASSIKCICDGTLTQQGAVQSPASSGAAATVGQTWTSSIYARGSGTVQIRMRESDSGGVTLATSLGTGVALTDAWQRITYTYTTGNASCAYLTTGLHTNSTQAVTFYFDAVQLEQKAYATSYADGAIGTGYAWSGTAHASSSTRTATVLSASPTNRVRIDRGSVYARQLVDYEAALEAYAFGHINTDSRIYLYRRTSDDAVFGRIGSHAGQSSGSTLNVDTWNMAGVEWDSANYRVVSGTTVGSDAAHTGMTAIGATMYIGVQASVGHLNGLIGPVAIANRPLTARERAKLYALTSWAWGTLRGGRVGLLVPR